VDVDYQRRRVRSPELLSLSTLESLGLGIPVIVSNIGGMREIVKDGNNGFLVDPGDDAAIADRVSLICSDSKLFAELATKALESSHLFNWSNSAARCIGLYRNLLWSPA
jgi:glycosyltransferase involved in cell wall biosynthesis